MRRAALAVVLGLSACLVAACSLYGRLGVFNNTGSPLIVQMSDGLHLPGSGRIGPGNSRSFSNGDVAAHLVVESGRCVYSYDLPFPEVAYYRVNGDPKRARPLLNVQVEPDFSLLLLPVSAARVARPAELAGVQAYGYPVRPVSKTCG
ncbi:MAG TPA: hypothetical protein VHN73_01190 [Phenylobacterium sp.]|nr:hypothetical protein [Phenylobacterium sp.]